MQGNENCHKAGTQMEMKILTGRGKDFEAVMTTRDLRPVTKVSAMLVTQF